MAYGNYDFGDNDVTMALIKLDINDYETQISNKQIFYKYGLDAMQYASTKSAENSEYWLTILFNERVPKESDPNWQNAFNKFAKARYDGDMAVFKGLDRAQSFDKLSEIMAERRTQRWEKAIKEFTNETEAEISKYTKMLDSAKQKYQRYLDAAKQKSAKNGCTPNKDDKDQIMF